MEEIKEDEKKNLNPVIVNINQYHFFSSNHN
jgi:hypothetical protein